MLKNEIGMVPHWTERKGSEEWWTIVGRGGGGRGGVEIGGMLGMYIWFPAVTFNIIFLFPKSLAFHSSSRQRNFESYQRFIMQWHYKTTRACRGAYRRSVEIGSRS